MHQRKFFFFHLLPPSLPPFFNLDREESGTEFSQRMVTKLLEAQRFVEKMAAKDRRVSLSPKVTGPADPADAKPLHSWDGEDVYCFIGQTFTEAIALKFKDEDIDGKSMIRLSKKDDEDAIFSKLGLTTFGKIVKFKNEVEILLPAHLKRCYTPSFVRSDSSVRSKPSMTDLATFGKEMEMLYKAKSQIQKAAVKVWPGNEFPNFRTAENKNKLDELAESLKEECSIPEIQFGVEGIRKHIQSVFNERRRSRKREKIDYDLPDKRMSLKDDKGKPPLPTMSVYDNDEVNKNKESNDSNEGSDESGDTEILNSLSENSDHDGPDESQPALKKAKKTKKKNVTGKKQNKNDSSQSSNSNLKADQEVSAINLSAKSAKVLLLTYSGEAAVEDISREYLYQIIKELGGKVSLAKQLQGDALFKAVAVKLVNHGLVSIKAGATLTNLKRSDIITK
ncbi:uncharacterized protein LOC144648485 isoform X2 [Oculina patagonica]